LQVQVLSGAPALSMVFRESDLSYYEWVFGHKTGIKLYIYHHVHLHEDEIRF